MVSFCHVLCSVNLDTTITGDQQQPADPPVAAAVAATRHVRLRRNISAADEGHASTGRFDAAERRLVLHACTYFEHLISTVNAFPNIADEAAMIQQAWGWACRETRTNPVLDDIKMRLVCFF